MAKLFRKNLVSGWALIGGGALLIALCLGSDILGLGASAEFGHKQIAGAMAGFLFSGLGVSVAYRRNQEVGGLFLGTGILLFVLAVFADAVGIGKVDAMGSKQIAAAASAVVVAVVGYILANRKSG